LDYRFAIEYFVLLLHYINAQHTLKEFFNRRWTGARKTQSDQKLACQHCRHASIAAVSAKVAV